MAVLDASNSEISFTSLAAYGSLVEASPDIYSWLTPDPFHQIRALGTGFTYSGSTPTGGTVTSVTFDYHDNNHPYGVTDVTITGVSVPLTSLVDLTDPAAGEARFWDTLLFGNDTIFAPLAAGGKLFGDFEIVTPLGIGSIARSGGSDEFFASNGTVLPTGLSRGGVGSPNALIGDAVSAQGVATGSFVFTATVNGGDDTFTVSNKANFVVVGDVQFAGTNSIVNGGADTVTSALDVISATQGNRGGIYVGDVEVNLGSVFGGDDDIRGTNFAFTNEFIIGDVIESGDVGAAALLVGGNDRLIGRAGQEFMAGDVFRMQGGSMTGGNDRIFGGQDSDVISGDAMQSIGLQFIFPIGGGPGTQITTTISLTGGNDRLFGDEGNDWIVGDLWNGDGIVDPSTIVGGNDFISGGDGDDMLYGDIGADYIALLDQGGDDTLDGGLGDDIIDGQLGTDTASFASVAAAVVVDLALGTATGQGNDVLVSIENLVGSSRNDQLSGDGGNNTIDGGDGRDLIRGRGGNDILIDGAGIDKLRGGSGVDSFRLTADGEADNCDGGGDADVIDVSAATSDVTVTFTSASGNGTVSGGGFGNDTFKSVAAVAGSDNAAIVDTVIGAGGSQLFFLQGGNDIAFGNGGDDAIAGQAGRDRIDGGNGNDTMNGGNGNDTFVFSTVLNAASNVDNIEDFATGHDTIELSAGMFSGLAAGILKAAAFVSGSGLTEAADASDRIIYDTSTGDVYFDADGTGSGSTAILFATLANHPADLAASDFMVV